MKTEIDKICQLKGLNAKKSLLNKLLLNKNKLSTIWVVKKGNYYILQNKKRVYSESFQHVSAVAKLMRIPNELWVAWVDYVLFLSNYKPLKYVLNIRKTIFQKAFGGIICPYYEENNKDSILVNKSPCLLCKNKSFRVYKRKGFYDKNFFVYICLKCGLGIKHPRYHRTQLESLYQDKNYFSGQTTKRGYFNYAAEEPWRIDKAKQYLHILELMVNLNPTKSKILDVGAGYGYFLKVLKDNNYNHLGIELSSAAVSLAKEKYNVNILSGDLISLFKKKLFSNSSFDLITLWDVLEHFYDFRDELLIISKILKPGGYVALRTNNINSIEFQVFGKYFHSIKDEHTFYFNKNNLKQIFNKFGIEEVKKWTHTHLFLGFMTKDERNMINNNCLGGDIFLIGKKHEKN